MIAIAQSFFSLSHCFAVSQCSVIPLGFFSFGQMLRIWLFIYFLVGQFRFHSRVPDLLADKSPTPCPWSYLVSIESMTQESP